MSTTLTPPPASSGPPPQYPQNPPSPEAPKTPSRSAAKVIAILTLALGGAVVLVTAAGSVVSTVAAASVSTSMRTLAVSGVDDLELNVAAGSMRVEFADVDEAELEVTAPWAAGAGTWKLERDGDTLEVASPDWRFGGPWMFGGRNGDAVLRLPSALEGLDASLDLGAGELSAEGEFGDVELDLGAGRAELTGTASSLTGDVSAGRADIDLSGVRTADLTVSAGALQGALTGEQPGKLTIDVSAGSLDLTIPEGDYDVRSDVSAGDFHNGVGSVPGADSTIAVTVSAGRATLNAG